MNDKIKSGISLALKVAFASGIIGYMIYSGRLDLEIVRKGFSQTYVVILGFMVVSFSTGISFLRWKLLLKGQGIEIPMGPLVRYGMIGAFFNTTMPGAVSGDLIKAWYVLADYKGAKKTPILTSIFLDRMFGVFGLIVVSASPILLFYPQVLATPKLLALSKVVMLLFVGVVVFFAYIFLSVLGPLAKLREWMKFLQRNRAGAVLISVYDAILMYRNSPSTLILSLLLSALNHLCLTTIVILCAHALGESHIALYQFFLIVPLGLLTTAVPVAPSGLGVGHAAFGALFSLVGSEHGAEVFTMFVTFQILVNLSGVFFYLTTKKVTQPEGVAV